MNSTPPEQSQSRTPLWMKEILHYNAVEVHPIEELTAFDGTVFHEQCDPDEADFWSVFAHLKTGGVECLMDFDTAAEASEFAAMLRMMCPHLRYEEPCSGHRYTVSLVLTTSRPLSAGEKHSLMGNLEEHISEEKRCGISGFTSIRYAEIGEDPPADSISLGWSVADVREVRPDLTPEQCREVLREVEDRHDATTGITWDTLSQVADALYPEPQDAAGNDG